MDCHASTTVILVPRWRMFAALAAAALLAGLAHAQDAPAANGDKKEDGAKLETVVVSATKRVQPLQTVPIAISVVGGSQLERANLNTLGGVATQVPTVNYRTGAGNKDTSLFIRGVGTISGSAATEPTVSAVIDGVVSARPGQSTMDLLDVDRVEVLRGPQGTLFGKNASAGVINIITRAPGKELERYIDAYYFQGNERRVRTGISGEIVPDLLRGSLALMHADYKGNVTNVADGSTVNGYRRNGFRAKLGITPGAGFKVALIADHAKSFDNAPMGAPTQLALTAYLGNVVGAPNLLYAAAVAPVVVGPANRQVNSEMTTHVDDINWGLSGQIDWGVGGHTVTSITALRKWENTQYIDLDRLAAVYRQFVQTADVGHVNFSQSTQELRIASPKGRAVNYVAGFFYMRGRNGETYRRDVTRCAGTTAAALPSGLVSCSPGSTTVDRGDAVFTVDSASTSLFGESTINFSDRFRAIAGLRWTSDKLSYTHRRVSTQPEFFPGVRPAFNAAGSTDSSAYSGRLGPQVDLNQDATVYLTYSSGYKGPAFNVFFNMQDFDTNPLKPETSKSVEVGLKSTLLNHRLRLNLAAFDTRYDGYQSNLSDLVGTTIVTRLINAGTVSTRGVELDMQAKLTRGISISGAAARIIARIGKFNCPPGAAAGCAVDGKPLPFSPDWRINLRGNYRMQLNEDLALDVGMDYNWQSRILFDIGQAPDAFQPAYGIINASITLSNSGKGWRFDLIGKNLANKSYANLLSNGGGFFVRSVPRDDQRYFGVHGRLDF
jgi:iron complex outermembrane receptor protein